MIAIMMQSVNPIVLIPSRMGSTRLPNKPLADIAGLPMIVQVLRRALEADIGPVLVACGEKDIFDVVSDAGGDAVLTNSNHNSGSDRIYEALVKIDVDQRFNVIVNLQGDLPTIDCACMHAILEPLKAPACDISTLVAEITREEEKNNPDVVKAAVAFEKGALIARALYFSRSIIPAGDGPVFHHIGVYGYRRRALESFVKMSPGILEARERLEQIRALENGLRIDAALVDTLPVGVDTPADLERARHILGISKN